MAVLRDAGHPFVSRFFKNSCKDRAKVGQSMPPEKPMIFRYTILYVDNAAVTLDFYSRAFALDHEPPWVLGRLQ